MREQKFFMCKNCGKLVGVIDAKCVAPIVCCGETMSELTPNTADASKEKHVPVVTVADGQVSVDVGSIAHPMEDAHHISFVYIKTERGGQRKNLNVGETPKAVFKLADDKLIAVYAYCNLHGLWVATV